MVSERKRWRFLVKSYEKTTATLTTFKVNRGRRFTASTLNRILEIRRQTLECLRTTCLAGDSKINPRGAEVLKRWKSDTSCVTAFEKCGLGDV